MSISDVGAWSVAHYLRNIYVLKLKEKFAILGDVNGGLYEHILHNAYQSSISLDDG